MSAQRYDQDPRALERMSRGRCPECGHPERAHTGWGGPASCGLTDNGVAGRIVQYQEDVASACTACGCRPDWRCDVDCVGEPTDDGHGPHCARCSADLQRMIEDDDEPVLVGYGFDGRPVHTRAGVDPTRRGLPDDDEDDEEPPSVLS